ncbi:hypothetical protein SELMODRAFT_428247 [Selaginella moellendorffii]|uniref:Uncharacterized protein n=1 Tax=Selaginella moellendorffii TaxID=88036 RepID=D8T278_SELML|nr:hypothetical protein SELMODRAFT_428247 [Selaginella moellendorffii]
MATLTIPSKHHRSHTHRLEQNPGNRPEEGGCEEAYEAMLLQGIGSGISSIPREISYFAMVAFPGAGKATLGRRAREFLLTCWNAWPDGRNQAVLGLDDADYELFKSMAASSLWWNRRRYIPSFTERRGGLRGYRWRFGQEVSKAEAASQAGECAGFLRLALCVHSDTWLLPCVFFDELNVVTQILGGQSAGRDGKIFSDYDDKGPALHLVVTVFIFCKMVQPEQWVEEEVTFVLQRKQTNLRTGEYIRD